MAHSDLGTHLYEFHKMSRLDPCSVDFGRETPKFRFEFCRGFFGGFFPRILSKEKSPEKIHQKIPRKIHPGLCSEKFPSDFCRSLFLTKCGVVGCFGGIFVIDPTKSGHTGRGSGLPEWCFEVLSSCTAYVLVFVLNNGPHWICDLLPEPQDRFR